MGVWDFRLLSLGDPAAFQRLWNQIEICRHVIKPWSNTLISCTVFGYLSVQVSCSTLGDYQNQSVQCTAYDLHAAMSTIHAKHSTCWLKGKTESGLSSTFFWCTPKGLLKTNQISLTVKKQQRHHRCICYLSEMSHPSLRAWISPERDARWPLEQRFPIQSLTPAKQHHIFLSAALPLLAPLRGKRLRMMAWTCPGLQLHVCIFLDLN